MGILCSRVDHSCLWKDSYFPLENFPFFLLMSMCMSSICSFMIPYPLSLCVCLFICLCICPLPSHSFSWTRTFPLSLGSPLPSFRSKLPGSSSQIKGKILGTFGRQLQPTLHSSLYHTYLHNIILEVSKSYLHYMDISETLQQGMSPQKFEAYELREDGILMYRCRVYVSND